MSLLNKCFKFLWPWYEREGEPNYLTGTISVFFPNFLLEKPRKTKALPLCCSTVYSCNHYALCFLMFPYSKLFAQVFSLVYQVSPVPTLQHQKSCLHCSLFAISFTLMWHFQLCQEFFSPELQYSDYIKHCPIYLSNSLDLSCVTSINGSLA